MKEIIENFGLNSTFWVQLINFSVLMLIFVKWGLKPIQRIIKERQKHAQKLLNLENEWQEKLAELEKEYNHKIAEAEDKASKIVAEAKKYAEALKNRIGDELYKYKQEETTKFNKYLEAKKAEFKSELQNQIVNDFKKALGEVLQENPDLAEKITTALIDKMSVMDNE